MKKTISFAVMHFVVAFCVAWALTGDIFIGGAIALVEPAVNTVAYYWHERFWVWRDAGVSPGANTTPDTHPLTLRC